MKSTLHFILVKEMLADRLASLIFVVVSGIASGITGIVLLAFINSYLHSAHAFDEKDALVFLALVALVTGSWVASSIGMTRIVQAVVRDLRLQLSRQIMAASYSTLQKLGSARLMANLTEDVSVLSQALQRVSQICISMAWLVGGLAYMAWLSLSLFLFVISVIVFGAVIYYLHSRLAMRPLHSAREQDDALYTHFRALTQGVKELKLHRHRAQGFLKNGLVPTAKASCQLNISAMIFFIVAAAWGSVVLYILMGIVLYGAHNWWNVTDETVVSGYILTLLYIFGPISVLIDSIPELGRAKVSLIKINTLRQELEERINVTGDVALYPVPAQSCTIELKEMCFSYHQDGSDFTLGPLNLMLNPGELVFITGGNGSGKSSLMLLLVGLYTPEQGSVLLNGEPVTDTNRLLYRQQFSAIFSDFYLFESLLGLSDDQLDQQAQHYLKWLQLDHKVSVKDGVFSTIALSQGQRKRLALLTALLDDRPVYVFDEWAADQDPQFKELFYTHILADLKARGKTVVAITHDDRYFYIADRCIKLDNGVISEITEHPGLRMHQSAVPHNQESSA
ncbi:MAG: cyclic peptide export ABC transporter [Nitrosomonas sp.]|nr:cyclic peptide export ABC transporter [Nitrosomonas sp.]MCW5608734.1 cyclic peptide export ABC transporter [Nitrosomonas sp.]